MEDSVSFLESDEAGLELLGDVQLAPGQAMAISCHEFVKELKSDEAMTYIFFYGFGAPLVKQTDEYSDMGPFVVDLDVSKLEVREGFRPYGARAHFDSAQKLTAIYDYAKETLVKPGEDGWEQAKCLLKQTVGFIITGREHLLWTHLLCANEVTLACENHLPPSHPLRRLLNVFTFRTNYINNSAFQTLMPEGSIFFRGSALTYDSLQTFMDESIGASNIFEPFADRSVGPALMELGKENKFPYLSDSIAYFEIVRSFVRDWLGEAGDKAMDDQSKDFYNQIMKSTEKQAYTLPSEFSMDSTVNLIAQHIFNVTAFHGLVGQVNTYTQYQSGVGLRLVDNATSTDLQSYLIGAVITALRVVQSS
jgi:hypothetical protein